jgi:hypothetical protein
VRRNVWPWVLIILALAGSAAAEDKDPATKPANAFMWVDPGDIKAKNLLYGPGGQQGQPQPPFTYEKEDTSGTSTKFDVRDGTGTRWRVKLGDEAQPETVASRLLWAVGYGANINYLVPTIQVQNLPGHLKRGQNFEKAGGTFEQARLQRHAKREGDWDWRHNPFIGTREFNGLRVMMGLISNWDLKTDNNAIIKDDEHSDRKIYEVSDVGATFGMSGKSYTDALSKNDLPKYKRSHLLAKVTPKYVDLAFPSHPPIFYVFNFPLFIGEMRTRWIGKHIPREDAKWIGSLLAQLTPEQIRDAFRAAGYKPEQVEEYARAVESRIAELGRL